MIAWFNYTSDMWLDRVHFRSSVGEVDLQESLVDVDVLGQEQTEDDAVDLLRVHAYFV